MRSLLVGWAATVGVGAAVMGGCQSGPKSEAPKPAAIELFNGTSLDGWVRRGGEASFEAEGGMIVGTTRPNQPNSFLCTVGEYGDFELELEFKVDPELNSGVQIRSQSLPGYKNGQVHGYQVEIDPSSRAWTAGIYDEGRRGWLAPLDKNPAAQAAFRQDQWNSLRILAQGDLIKTWLNGVPAAEVRDSMTPRGFIALQVHGVGPQTREMRVRWRNIRLHPLSPATNPQGSADGGTGHGTPDAARTDHV